jgi:hypothetical protein
MSFNLTDLAFKILVNRNITDSAKKYYEEFGDNTININSGEIWSFTPTFNDPTTAVSLSIAQKYGTELSPYILTEDVTVPNQQSWYTGPSFSSRLKNWISPKYGDAYRVKLYDGNNVEIPQTDSSGWFFNYPTGVLIFSGSTTDFVKPFKIVGHRYVGTFGAGGSSNGLYSETNFASQTSVTVVHGWGTKPNVTIVDSSNQVLSGTIQFVDNNTVTVTFLSAQTGTIILQSRSGSPIITTDLNGLSDVTITSPASGDTIRWNGSSWINIPDNSTPPVSKYTDTVSLSANVATTINHNLGSTDIIVQCYNSNQVFVPVITIINANTVTVESSTNKPSSRIIILS